VDGSVLILASGVFYYFEEKEVRELVCRIIDHFPTGEIFFDAQSKMAVKISNHLVRKAGNKGSQMKFWVNAPARLKGWSAKIHTAKSIPFFGEIRKANHYKLSTKLNMWGYDTLKMGYLISIKW
jgi:O-methyltransferase involved in polyketide biosynthesis